MICLKCNIEKKEEDYLLGSHLCYKCVYASKKKVIKYCKECRKKLAPNRWKYCGEKCAKIGHLKQKKDYLFTNKIPKDHVLYGERGCDQWNIIATCLH